MMITDGSRTQDTILVHLYSLIGVSSLNVLELSEDLRKGGLDVTDKEVEREVEALCRKGLLSFMSDYIEESAYSAQDDPLWVTSVGCSAAEAVMSRIADTVVVAANDTKNNDNGNNSTAHLESKIEEIKQRADSGRYGCEQTPGRAGEG